jgi:hypothetical protein
MRDPFVDRADQGFIIGQAGREQQAVPWTGSSRSECTVKVAMAVSVVAPPAAGKRLPPVATAARQLVATRCKRQPRGETIA